MLNKLQKLSVKADGRYAKEPELQFIELYLASFNDRVSAYKKVQDTEGDLVEAVYHRLIKANPQFFSRGGQDYTPKWRSDTLRVVRFATMALLYDDEELYKEKFLYWFQTLMYAFATQDACSQTYAVMQEEARTMLPPQTAKLFCPILELTRTILGRVSDG
jgi:hypothetical protein